MAFNKQERRYRRKKGEAPKIEFKVRKLAYPSNMDACIFAYYAEVLNEPYEKLIKRLGIDDAVIGYRKVGSNIDLALSAFSEIKARGSCVAFAFDISGFFDNIDHAVLKQNWCRVLNVSRLPDGHYQVFRALTHFSFVDKRACLRRLGFKTSARDRDIPKRPICTIHNYRTHIKGKGGASTSLVSEWKRDYRVPQGTPLSALAANIAMLDFDVAMQKAIKSFGGSFRRYSDDILVIVPSHHRSHITDIVNECLKYSTRRLKLNSKKTDVIEFIPGALATGAGTKALQYLGFLFDGDKTLLRSGTLAKFHRRLHRAVNTAVVQQKNAAAGKIVGRATIHKRTLLASNSHLGSENFVRSYAERAAEKFQQRAIKKQISGNAEKIVSLIDRRLNRNGKI